MRNSIKNKSRTIYLLNFKQEIDAIDDNGNYTGEKVIIYSPKKAIKVNLSGAMGSSQSEVFGSDIHYDKSFVLTALEKQKLGLNENSVFFVDIAPKYDGLNPLYDYRVERIAETINEVVVAITKVRK